MVSLYERLCDYRNLELAFRKARKGKTKKRYVSDFETHLEENLLQLQSELEQHTYKPKPLESFILKEGKTRRISRSDFRDRVVHHALCNVIEPLFDKTFIFDSYANRKGKGVLKALKRFDVFKRKVSQNHTGACLVLKADVRKYFDTVEHEILLAIVAKRVPNERVLWLVKQILGNFRTTGGKGMPLGNLTSQFFANVYLNELDQFVKHELRVQFYIRYVDDFVILSDSKGELVEAKRKIDVFLKEVLLLRLHPEKSRVIELEDGVPFLGFRVFPHHRLLLKKNLGRFQKKRERVMENVEKGVFQFDELYDFIEGWAAFARGAQTYKVRRKVIREVESRFQAEVSAKDVSRYMKFSAQTPKS